MTALIWFGFFFSLGLLILIARKSLWLGLVIASYVLGLFSFSFKELWHQTFITLTDPSILLLALAVGIIPIIGGAMERGGLMDILVNNLRMKRKSFMAFASAFIGLLPIPGGALLSAPLIDRGGETVPNRTKTAINVWFRHVFLLIYPLGALLATTSMANLNLYSVILYLVPGFTVMMLLGYLLFLKGIKGNNSEQVRINRKKLAIPITVIILAPFMHFTLTMIFKNIIQEIPLVIGVSLSLILAFYFGHLGWEDFKAICQKMKPWNFALLILGMFLFLHIFKASETSRVIAEASFSKVFLIVGMGALLGFTTGRVNVPISILLPIYFAQYGHRAMTPLVFAVMFFAVYQGYIISPVHPCVLVTLEFFNTELRDFYKLLALPGLIGIGIAWIVGMSLF